MLYLLFACKSLILHAPIHWEDVCSIELGRNLSTNFHTLLWHLLDQISLQGLCDLHQFQVKLACWLFVHFPFMRDNTLNIKFLKIKCHFLKDN
jgi:hypothetical protein